MLSGSAPHAEDTDRFVMENAMSIPIRGLLAVAAAAAVLASAAPSHALTMKECSAKYKTAKSSGALKGMTWNEFRKAECSADAAKTGPAATTGGTKRATAPIGRALSGGALFPTAISPKYANETAGKARMHTCLDQYRANKASNSNGGLKWIEKGGGYYSECNKRLSRQ